MIGGQLKLCRNACRVLTGAHQARIRARAKREPKRVEQDRLTCASLTRKHAKAGLELKLELFDQYDIVDDELPQHGDRPPGVTCWRPSAGSGAVRNRATSTPACTR